MQIKITILPDLGNARSVEFTDPGDARDFFERMLPQEETAPTIAPSDDVVEAMARGDEPRPQNDPEPVIPKRGGILGIFSRR